MKQDSFEPFELDKMIEAMQLLVKTNTRDRDAEHLLQLLIAIKEDGDMLSVIEPSIQQNAGRADQARPALKKETSR